MNRRRRALAFLVAAALAAATAAAIADGYGDRVARGYGELRSVVVLTADLPAGRAIDPRRAAAALEVRRVPARFVPVGALRAPAEALGLLPRTAVPAGSYLAASQLRPPRPRRTAATGLDRGLRPVQIVAAGGAALLASGPAPGRRVDVVVTREPTGSGPGRAYVAAAAVPLLAIGPGGDGLGPGTVAATLGLTRRQALKLIAAESFARQLTLLPRG